MKAPFEVYFESFVHKLRELPLDDLPWPAGDPRHPFVWEAFKLSLESTVYHLVDAERWPPPRARSLVDEFFKASIEWLNGAQAAGEGDRGRLREMLRHREADWKLRPR